MCCLRILTLAPLLLDSALTLRAEFVLESAFLRVKKTNLDLYSFDVTRIIVRPQIMKKFMRNLPAREQVHARKHHDKMQH